MSRGGRAWVALEDGLVLEARSVAAPGTALTYEYIAVAQFALGVLAPLRSNPGDGAR